MENLSFLVGVGYETNPKPLKINTVISNSGGDLEQKPNISPVQATPLVSPLALLPLIFRRRKHSKCFSLVLYLPLNSCFGTDKN